MKTRQNTTLLQSNPVNVLLYSRKGKSDWLDDVIKGSHNHDNCVHNHKRYKTTYDEDLHCKYRNQAYEVQSLLQHFEVKKEEDQEISVTKTYSKIKK